MHHMLIVRATRKLLPRLRAPKLEAGDESTTLLGDWYATSLPWRPHHLALFVSQTTLLPVLLPLAPAATLLQRFPEQLAEVLTRHRIDPTVIEQECKHNDLEHRIAPTANRSVVGSMNEFVFLANAFTSTPHNVDPIALSMHLAEVPCGPLYKRHITPDKELQALLGTSQAE